MISSDTAKLSAYMLIHNKNGSIVAYAEAGVLPALRAFNFFARCDLFRAAFLGCHKFVWPALSSKEYMLFKESSFFPESVSVSNAFIAFLTVDLKARFLDLNILD